MAQVQTARDLRANRLLAALEPEDLASLEPYLEVVDLSRGAVLYETGEFINYAYFPHSTVVSLINVLEDGTTVEVAAFGREGVLGLLSALVTRESFGRYIVRLSGCASRIPVDRLNKIRNERPKLRLLLMRYGEALLAQTFQTVSCNAVHSVEVRCCGWILSTRDRIDQKKLPLTHEFLAEMLGVQRSTVSTVLRSLQDRGLIAQHRGAISLLNQGGLEESACECYRRIRAVYERLLPKTYMKNAPK